MVIEWLRFEVFPQSRDLFIQYDDEIWTPMLARFPGFLSKELWISPDNDQEIIIVILWETREQWKAIPQDILEVTEQNFSKKMQSNTYKIIEAKEYQVRKIPNS